MTKIPTNNKRKPTPKKSFSMQNFKKKIGGEDIPDKSMKWIPCAKAMKEATGLPGIPKGYVTLARGFSNTGKSTLACEAAVAAQKMGILPIIIDTENNIGEKRLKLMGLDFNNDFYLFIDNDYLLQNYGKKQNKNRNEAAIEDMGACINDLLDMQDSGELPYDLLFIIDSLGTLDCIKSVDAMEKDTTNNNMWNAGAFERTFKYLINNRIPSSRKENKEYTNTIIGVQKIWIDNMGAGVVKHKGGEAFFYGARLIYHYGGIVAHSTKKITATSKGRDVSYGIETKVGVIKNQINDDLGGIAMEGKIVSTPHGFIGVDKEDIEKYKKENIQFFREVLGSNVGVDDLATSYSRGDDSMDCETLQDTLIANNDFDQEKE